MSTTIERVTPTVMPDQDRELKKRRLVELENKIDLNRTSIRLYHQANRRMRDEARKLRAEGIKVTKEDLAAARRA